MFSLQIKQPIPNSNSTKDSHTPQKYIEKRIRFVSLAMHINIAAHKTYCLIYVHILYAVRLYANIEIHLKAHSAAAAAAESF